MESNVNPILELTKPEVVDVQAKAIVIKKDLVKNMATYSNCLRDNDVLAALKEMLQFKCRLKIVCGFALNKKQYYLRSQMASFESEC